MSSVVDAVGALYLEDCPVQRFIPIYLVVGGSVAVFMNLCGIIQSICQLRDPERERSVADVVWQVAEGFIGCFMIAWFIAGA